MTENGDVYARLVNDLYEVVCETTGHVGKIDKSAPDEISIHFGSTTANIGENVTATVTQSDSLSGIDIENCKYAFTIGNEPLGTEDVSKYPGNFETDTNDTLTLNCSTAATYYLHVLSVDFVGNKVEKISEQGVKSTVTRMLIQDGKIGDISPTLAHTEVEFGGTPGYFNTTSVAGTGFGSGYWKFRLWWANGFGSLGSVYWRIPVLGENATITAEYIARCGGRRICRPLSFWCRSGP